ncbi:MAG: hypothetical protein ACLPHP_21850 [Candidatus Sulfotelmatobacter sp.]
MKNPLLHLLAVLVLVGTCWCQSRGGQDYWTTVVPITEVLRKGKISGSLEYWGSCNVKHIFPDFPAITAPSSPSAPPLQALREMFANDEDMQVTQEPDGTIRMVEKSVPQDLLNVKIGHISFDEENKTAQPMWFPINVLRFITHLPEVETFKKEHGIRQIGDKLSEASSPIPRVSGELNNVTLSQALDYGMETFHGLWVYENCPGSGNDTRVVVFAFYRSGQ